MTVLKAADDKQPLLDALGALLVRPEVDAATRKRIEQEIRLVNAGAKGERDAAYEIDFHYGGRDGHAVIHDLRLEVNGREAQIDHLILNRVLDIWVCETKSFREGVRINEQGEWSRYGGRFAQGMASPVRQNERHVEVLRDVFRSGAIRLPHRIVTLQPSLFPAVLVSNDARIDRPRSKRARDAVPGLQTVIKVEELVATIDRSFDERNPLALVGKIVSAETVQDLGQQLVALHRPLGVDWVAPRFGLKSPPNAPSSAAARPVAAVESASLICDSCARPVSERVAAFSRENAERFAGRILCWDCQRSGRMVSA